MWPYYSAERPELRHAGPDDVSREAELEQPSRVACSELLDHTFGFILTYHFILFPEYSRTRTASRATCLVNESFQIHIAHLEKTAPSPRVPAPPRSKGCPSHTERLQ